MRTAEPAFILRVLEVIARADACDELYWRCDGEYAPVTFWLNCNDLFWWGTADSEEITPENLPLLEQSLADVKASGARCSDATSLFACRARRLRPQGAAYPADPLLWSLFDACGPQREVGVGNPRPQPTRSWTQGG